MSISKVTKLVKEYNDARNERLALDQASAKLKVREDAILDELTALGVTSGRYGPYMIDVGTKPMPRCTDWNGFHAWVQETGSFDCMHKRLTESALKARYESGEYVPGIVWDDKVTYKFNVA
jgi:hypothetical protein